MVAPSRRCVSERGLAAYRVVGQFVLYASATLSGVAIWDEAGCIGKAKKKNAVAEPPFEHINRLN